MRFKVESFSGRLDIFLSGVLEGVSRSRIQKVVTEQGVVLNGKRVTGKSVKLEPGDIVEVEIPDFVLPPVLPEEGPLHLIFEDEHLAIVNKPAGMLTHPTESIREGTLVNRLLARFTNLPEGSGPDRPGIVHRLDRDTTGLMIIALTEKTREYITRMIRKRSVQRQYLTIVEGVIEEDEGRIDAPLGRDPRHRLRRKVLDGGREARTHFTVLERLGGFSYLSVDLETGRTHQIRAHFSYIAHPVAGDTLYGARRVIPGTQRPLLHSARLRFTHPVTGESLDFRVDPPEDFRLALDYARDNAN